MVQDGIMHAQAATAQPKKDLVTSLRYVAFGVLSWYLGCSQRDLNFR